MKPRARSVAAFAIAGFAAAAGCSLVIGDKDLTLASEAGAPEEAGTDAIDAPTETSADAKPDGAASFGEGGVVVEAVGEGDAGINAMAASGSSIVVAGYATISGASRFAVARYRADGTRDPAFSDGGVVTTAIGSSAVAQGVAVLSDGRIVAVGWAVDPSDGNKTHFAVARYQPDGALDPAFGDAGAMFFRNANAVHERLNVVVAPNDTVYAAGHSGNEPQLVVMRFSQNGGLDPTFDSTTHPEFLGGDKGDIPSGLAVTPSGVFVGGTMETQSNEFDMFLARLDDAGALLGYTRIDFGTTAANGSASALGLAASPAGWVLGGTAGVGTATADFALARVLSQGGIDNSFGGDGGTVRTSLTGIDEGHAVAVDASGRILLAGSASGHTALARYASNGALDTSFGSGGVLRVPVDDSSLANAMLVLPDGGVVLGGSATLAGRSRFSLIKR